MYYKIRLIAYILMRRVFQPLGTPVHDFAVFADTGVEDYGRLSLAPRDRARRKCEANCTLKLQIVVRCLVVGNA